MTTIRTARPAALAAAVLALALAAPAGPQAQDDPKAYEKELAALAGAAMHPTAWKMVRDWKFEMISSWEGEKPEKEMIAKLLPKKLRFSKEEVEALFAGEGRYNVMVFSKKIGEEHATIGQVDAFGMTAGKDSGVASEKHMVIRLVFFDKALVQSKLWPKIERGSISGGMNYRR